MGKRKASKMTGSVKAKESKIEDPRFKLDPSKSSDSTLLEAKEDSPRKTSAIPKSPREENSGPSESFQELQGPPSGDGEVIAYTKNDSETSPSKDDDDNDEDEVVEMDRLEESSTQQNHKKVIDLDKLSRTTQKIDKTGLIYLARIPVGMGPGKVKYLLSKWGTVNRIYLARHEEAKTIKVKKGKEKHQSYQFKEGWIEFEDKRVARRVAELLNTRPIGGKASDRYSSELWSLKYLPKFKWSNLSDQMAVERRLREQLQRNSLEDSKKDQDWYLRMVEKNRVGNKIQEKEISRKGKVVNSTRWTPKEHKQRNIRASDTRGETNQQTSTGSRSNTDGMKTVLSNLL